MLFKRFRRTRPSQKQREFTGGYFPTERVTGPPPPGAALETPRPGQQEPAPTSPQDSADLPSD